MCKGQESTRKADNFILILMKTEHKINLRYCRPELPLADVYTIGIQQNNGQKT